MFWVGNCVMRDQPNTTFENCIVHNNFFSGGGRGIYLGGTEHVVIENCVCYSTDYYFWLGIEAEAFRWWEGCARAK
jgi:parallel beta-helix repeat protein